MHARGRLHPLARDAVATSRAPRFGRLSISGPPASRAIQVDALPVESSTDYRKCVMPGQADDG